HEAGSDVVTLLDGRNENPAITDFAGSGGLPDHTNDVIDFVVVDDDLNHDFREQFYFVLDAAIDGAMSELTSMAVDLRNGHSGNKARESVHHIRELLMANDALDQFHCDCQE